MSNLPIKNKSVKNKFFIFTLSSLLISSLLIFSTPIFADKKHTFNKMNFNKDMTPWREYGFTSFPEGIYDLLEKANYQRASFKLRPYMSDSDGRVNHEAWLINARIMLNMHEYKEALRLSQRILGYYSNNPDLLAVTAYSYLYSRSDYDYASDFSDRLTKACKGCALAKNVQMSILKHKSIMNTL